MNFFLIFLLDCNFQYVEIHMIVRTQINRHFPVLWHMDDNIFLRSWEHFIKHG